MAKDGLSIAWSEVDITPDGVVDLSGQYYHRVSRGVHSRLSATVLALESAEGVQAVFVSFDSVGFQADFLEELRAAVRGDLPELDASAIIMNVTHSHNAPGVDLISGIGWLAELPGAMPIKTYRTFLLDKLKSAVLAAWKNRTAGGIANAFGHARVGHCRRAVYADGSAEMYGPTDRDDFTGMEGGEDSGIDLLFTFDPAGKPTGAIVNLACPSQVMEATYLVSSDFMGETRRLLKRRFGADFRVLGQISAAGDQAPRDLTRHAKGEPDFWHGDGVAELGKRVAAAVETAFGSINGKIEYGPILKHSVKKFALPRRRASEEDFRTAERRLKELEAKMSEAEAYRDFCAEVGRNEKIPGRPGPYDSKLHHFVLIQNNKAVVARHAVQDTQPSFGIESHILRLGNSAFATNPFELYLDFGQRIKARSMAYQTFVVQLCGGTGGYLPSERAEQLGGYGGLIINGEVGSEGGALLVDGTVREIAELWK